jgi:hypothetical protein
MIRIFTGIALSMMIASLFGLMSCCGPFMNPNEEEKFRMGYLINKKGGWKQTGDMMVPEYSATTAEQWTNFKVVFNETSMTTAGYPAGAEAIWSSGGYTIQGGVSSITRSRDVVVMYLERLTADELWINFTVPEKVYLWDTTSFVLSGDYSFYLK